MLWDIVASGFLSAPNWQISTFLPGSLMTGQIRWAVYGGGTAFVGLVLVVAANRRRQGVSPSGR
jgi:hypothetical protein